MLSIKTALFLSCVGLVVSFPGFFLPPRFNEEGVVENAEPLRAGDQPQFQLGSPSYEYDGASPGGSTSEEVSNEGGTGVLGAAGGETDGGETAEVDSPDAAENEAAENEAPAIGGPQAGGEQAAGDTSGAVDSPDTAALNTVDGGPELVKKGEKSTAGRNAGIAVGVIATVGLAAGVGFYVYRKKRAAAYGARF